MQLYASTYTPVVVLRGSQKFETIPVYSGCTYSHRDWHIYMAGGLSSGRHDISASLAFRFVLCFFSSSAKASLRYVTVQISDHNASIVGSSFKWRWSFMIIPRDVRCHVVCVGIWGVLRCHVLVGRPWRIGIGFQTRYSPIRVSHDDFFVDRAGRVCGVLCVSGSAAFTRLHPARPVRSGKVSACWESSTVPSSLVRPSLGERWSVEHWRSGDERRERHKPRNGEGSRVNRGARMR